MVAANTPPRSMSATSSTAAPAFLAMAKFTRSFFFKFSSTALPAPSRTMSS